MRPSACMVGWRRYTTSAELRPLPQMRRVGVGSGPSVPLRRFVGQLPRVGGGLQGCPLRVRPSPPLAVRMSCPNGLRRTRRRGSTRGGATRLAVGPPARAHRAPPRAPRAGQGVGFPAAGADGARPAIDVRFTGARASRYRADAKPGSQPGLPRPARLLLRSHRFLTFPVAGRRGESLALPAGRRLAARRNLICGRWCAPTRWRRC